MKQLLATLVVLLVPCAAAAQVITPNQAITVIDSGTACVTAPAACAIYALDQNTGGVTINVFGTWTGTLTFEGTNNNGTWVALALTTNVATGAQASTTTANGLFAITNVGVILVRVRATAAITGSAQITAAKGLGFARAGVNGTAAGPPALFADGTAGAPSIAFASEPTLGFRRSSAGNVTLQGAFSTTGAASVQTIALAAGPTGYLNFTGQGYLQPSADGLWRLQNNGLTIGLALKFDALPTVGSGFGSTPAVIAGSTPSSGSVNVGTGGAATTGVITFGGTAFPVAPNCTYSTQTTNAVTRGVPTTTQLTLNSTTAWTASDIVSWHCISSK